MIALTSPYTAEFLDFRHYCLSVATRKSRSRWGRPDAYSDPHRDTDGIIMLTFTPLAGMSDVVMSFLPEMQTPSADP